MAKTIKFNLILDNHPVRDIEGLREHFSVEDMLEYFNSGLLLRWLDIRGYEKESDAVKAINKSADKKEIITALVKIFEVDDVSEKYIERIVDLLRFYENKRAKDSEYKENGFAKDKIINDYFSEYEALIEHIEANKDDFNILKADALTIKRGFLRMFKLNCETLYSRFAKSAPKAVYAIITVNALRELWCENEKVKKALNSNFVGCKVKLDLLGEDLKKFQKYTSEWTPVTRPDESVLVLWHRGGGAYISGAENTYEKIGWIEHQGNELIEFKGLKYCCSETRGGEIYYLEVQE